MKLHPAQAFKSINTGFTHKPCPCLEMSIDQYIFTGLMRLMHKHFNNCPGRGFDGKMRPAHALLFKFKG